MDQGKKATVLISESDLDLIKDGIEDAQLEAKRVAFGSAQLFLLSIETFKANAETLPHLPNEIQACVVCHVICSRSL